MYLLKIAFRNLFRRRGRTLILSLILTLAVVFFLFMESMMMGLMDITFANIIDLETPHIEIGREEFFLEADEGNILPLEETFVPDDDMLMAINETQGVLGMTKVLDFSADFIAGRHEFPVRVRAIDPLTFGEVFRNQEYLVEGEFITGNGSGIVIGERLAEFFDLQSGDFFTLRFQDRRGAFNTMQGDVKGIVSVPHPDMNLGTVFVAKEQATKALNLQEDKVSQIMVRMENRDQALTQAQKLGVEFAGRDFQVRSYRDAAELLVALEAWGYLETYFILALFLLVGGIGIVSAIVLAAIERVKEIGMMKALGLKENEIVRVFILEAAGIGAIGGLIGCVLGAVVVYWLTFYGLDMEAFLDLGDLGVPLGDKLYGAWNTSSFGLIFIFVVAVAIIASIIPSYWAARKDPVEAIQHR